MRCKGRGQVGGEDSGAHASCELRTASWTIIASNDLFPSDPSEGLSIKWTAPAAHAKKNNMKGEGEDQKLNEVEEIRYWLDIYKSGMKLCNVCELRVYLQFHLALKKIQKINWKTRKVQFP